VQSAVYFIEDASLAIGATMTTATSSVGMVARASRTGKGRELQAAQEMLLESLAVLEKA
jgi:hypothetical protein